MMRTVFVLVLALLTGAASAQSDRQLVDRFDRADSERDHRAALVAAQAILERYPESAAWNFNAARAHAMLGELDEAIACLDRCAQLGYTGIASFEQHQDLNELRERGDFKAILELVRANAEKRLEEFKALAAKHTPATFVPQRLRDRLGPGEKPAILIALHGTGGNGQEMIDALRPVCEKLGVVCVAPDALRPAGGGFGWTYRDESAWLIDKTVREAIDEYNADPGRVILLGFSQGANIALAMAASGAEPFSALIPVCGHYEPDASAMTGTPPAVYLISGTRDPWHSTYDRAETDFTDAGAAVMKRVVPSMGHTMPGPRELERAITWALEQSGSKGD